MEQHIFSVTEVNELVKLLLDNEPMLSGICVRGEISNYKMYPSGHHYFSLKDATGAIRCVMFRGQAMRLRFRPENGMKVLVTGRVSVFPRDGAYQLYCNTMTPEGAGDLALAFEQLKERLYKEGLFDEGRKKPLPEFPERIAGPRYDPDSAAALPTGQGDPAAGAGTGSGSAAGDCRRYPVCRSMENRRCDHHRPGRRLHGGSLGL